VTGSDFCSRVSLSGEGVFPGTGVRAEIYVFLPVAKRFWGDSEFNTSWATPAELSMVRQVRKAGVVTRLYNPRNVSHARRALVLAAPTASSASGAAVSDLMETFSSREWVTENNPSGYLAICTQGTRDRCCAKWGFATYRAALRLFGENRFPFEPLECSHLGGDRYAATGIFFPSGSMYGHLDTVDLEAFGEAEAAGRFIPKSYRGRVFENELTQVVRAGLAASGYLASATSTVDIANPESVPDDLMVAAEEKKFRVSLGYVESNFYGSCKALAQVRNSRARRVVFAGAEQLSG
jgi:hypothetical protein